MEDVAFILLALVIGAVFWFCTWYFSAEQRTLRRIAAAPRRKIADVKDGEIVKIIGRLELHAPPVVAPISQRECAFYDAILEERVKRGKSSTWRTRIREHEAREFFVVDDTGRAFVEVVCITVVAEKDHHQSSGFLDDASPALEAYLSRHGETAVTAIGFNRTLRYREAILEHGEEVAVLGKARWELDPDPSREGQGYRGGAKRLVIEAPDDMRHPVLASDDSSAF